MSPSCFGLPGLKPARRRARWISASRPAARCANSPDSRDSTCRSIEMPRCSMRASTGRQRPLQRLVDGGDVLGRRAAASAPATVAAITSASSAAYSVALSIATLSNVTARLARAGQCAVVDRVGGSSQRSDERVQAVVGAAGVEHIGHQHRVVVRLRTRCRAGRQHLPVELDVVPDLQDARRPPAAACSASSAVRFLDLVGASPPANRSAAAAVAALAVRERHVAGLVRRERQRDAAQLGLHRIDGLVVFGVDRDECRGRVARAIQRLEPVEACGRSRSATGRTESCAAARPALRRAPMRRPDRPRLSRPPVRCARSALERVRRGGRVAAQQFACARVRLPARHRGSTALAGPARWSGHQPPVGFDLAGIDAGEFRHPAGAAC